MLLKIIVRRREVSAADESAIRRERTRVRGFEHEMSASVDELPFALGVTAPKHEHEMFTAFVECHDGGIGQFFPAFALITAGTMCLNGQRGIQQQHTLLHPTRKMSGCRR